MSTATMPVADADDAGVERCFVTLPLNGRATRVGLVRLWDDALIDETFRGAVADAFASVWPNRGGECNSIRRGLYRPERKPVPLVLVPLDGPDALGAGGNGGNGETPVLGYTIIYPSSKVKNGDGKEVGLALTPGCHSIGYMERTVAVVNWRLRPCALRGLSLHSPGGVTRLVTWTIPGVIDWKCFERYKMTW
jgi:hypothetical protein